MTPGSGPTADDWSGGSASGDAPGESGFASGFGGDPFRASANQPASGGPSASGGFPGASTGNPFARKGSSEPGWAAGFGTGTAEQIPAAADDDSATGNGPPVWMLIAGLLIPLATLPLLLLSGTAVHVLGWFVAIAGSLGFLTAFTVMDLQRRAKGSYADKPALLATLRIAVAVVGIVVAALHAYPVADLIARSDYWA